MNEVSNSTVWRLESAERCLFRQVEAFAKEEAKSENSSLGKNALDLVFELELQSFAADSPSAILLFTNSRLTFSLFCFSIDSQDFTHFISLHVLRNQKNILSQNNRF